MALACTSGQVSPRPSPGGERVSLAASSKDESRETYSEQSPRGETSPTESAGGLGSGHRFSPQEHKNHGEISSSTIVTSLANRAHTLPPFVNGSSRCFRSQYSHPTRKRSLARPHVASGSGSGLGLSWGGGFAQEKLKRGTSAPQAASPLPRAENAPRVARKTSPSSRRDGEDSRDIARSEEGERQSVRSPTQLGGEGVYLSNDDTMSLSSAQRVIWAIDHYAPIPQSHIRPHELLNYFSFRTERVKPGHDFSIRANIDRNAENPELFSLGLSIQGRALTRRTRRNANLSYVVDRSGSMSAEGRMEYLKQGLLRSFNELKPGDIVNIVLFDSSSCELAKNFMVGRDNLSHLRQLVRRMEPRGSTNLHGGLTNGYALANGSYQADYSNRVVLITDALTNTGVTNSQLIATVGRNYDDRRIRLSGVGVGSSFNDSLLDELTERGKGAYVFLGSSAEVDAVFGERFVSLIETVANNVHFKLSLPPSLSLHTFYGEEASVVKERVQAIHYFANTSQMFLSDLKSRSGQLPVLDDLMLTIEYEDPETGVSRVEETAWNIGTIAGKSANIDKALLLSRFALDLGNSAARTLPSRYSRKRHGWQDQVAYSDCEGTRATLEHLGAAIAHDPEVERIHSLWKTYCGRFSVSHLQRGAPERNVVPPRGRNNDFAPQDSWPSARR